MKFDKSVFEKQIIPFIDESFDKHQEIAGQLCKVNDKVVLGKKFYGDASGVSFLLKDMTGCESGEWVGDIHVETIPHKPSFPSDVDIKNNFDWIRYKYVEKPFHSCICSSHMKPEPREGKIPKRGEIWQGCYCEEWHPWTKEEHEKIMKKAEPYLPLLPRGWGYFPLWKDLIELGHIKNKQVQWIEFHFKMEDGKFLAKKFKMFHEEVEKI